MGNTGLAHQFINAERLSLANSPLLALLDIELKKHGNKAINRSQQCAQLVRSHVQEFNLQAL